VPVDTEIRIVRLCRQIVANQGEESNMEDLAAELHVALKEHICRAKSSLGTKASVIRKMDPEGD